MITYSGIYLGIFALTYIGVGLFIKWSKKKNLLDVPNERSSHHQPTPRGGGIVILTVCLISLFFFFIFTGKDIIWSYFAGAILVAGISWLDDVMTVLPIWRFLCHSLAALLIIWGLGSFTNIYFPLIGSVSVGIWGNIFTFFWIIWLINSYNFMDGIDGIAAVQTITAGFGWCFFGFCLGFETLGFWSGVLVFSAIAFLIYNWSPAKVFMGDVGSAFLGYSFAVLPLFANNFESNLKGYMPWFGLLFVWFFVFDSVLTLLKRLLKGERIWEAHRQHIYQKLVISGLSHIVVTSIYGLLSILLVILTIISLRNFGGIFKWLLMFVGLETVALLIILKTRKNSVWG